MRYPSLPASRVALEESVLETWREEDTFRRTLEATRDGEQFVFYEGPPTANGRPGLHHIISRAIKDLVCRYQTMLGKHVTRIAGWDTHGLPVEIEAQKRLGIEDKKEIEERGIAWFNERCKESVFTYKDEWERFSERIGYWLDYSRPYVTFHAEYVESVWWLLKRMADPGAPLPRPQGGPVVPARPDGAVVARTLAGVPGRRGSVALGDDGIAGWVRPASARVDHHAVDAGVECGARCPSGNRIRGGGARGQSADRCPEPCGGALRGRAGWATSRGG